MHRYCTSFYTKNPRPHTRTEDILFFFFFFFFSASKKNFHRHVNGFGDISFRSLVCNRAKSSKKLGDDSSLRRSAFGRRTGLYERRAALWHVLASSHLSLVEIAGDFGSRPYRAIRAVFCLLPFLHCGIASVHGENLEKETKEHWSPVLEVPFDLHWLNSVICCFTGQLLNMTYRCNVIKPIFLNFFVNRPRSRSRSSEHAVSPRNTEKRLGQREFTHRVQRPFFVHIINELFWRATQAWKLNDTIPIREKGLNSASGLTKPIISQYLE